MWNGRSAAQVKGLRWPARALHCDREVTSWAKLLGVYYFDAGLPASLEVTEFVPEIEDRFGVQFTEQDFQDRVL